MKVYFDTELHAMPTRRRKEQLDVLSVQPRESSASPRWVSCKRCGAYRGDECHTGKGWCAERIELNRKRLSELDTWAMAFQTPCHKVTVWLVWRSTQDLLTWEGVPCFKKGCGKTYTVERSVSDHHDERIPVEDINPHLVEMHCWAAEDANPWK